MSLFKSTLRHIAFSTLSVLGGVTLGAALVAAATTISTSITTAGGYTQSGSSENTFTGNTTLASTTATAFKVGQTGTRHTGILSGYCTMPATALTASSTTQVTCAGATGVTASYKVFVQATSSLPMMYVIQSATSSAGAIEVRILDTGLGTTTAGGMDPTSLNFWAVL